MSADITFFESIPYFSPQGPVTVSEFISLSPSVLLPAPTVVHDVSSPVSLKDTTTPPAPKPPRVKDFRHVYTHRQKVPASELVPATSSPVESPPPQPSVSFSDFDVPIALYKGKRSLLIILPLILIHMIILLPLFANFSCLCPLYLYSGCMRRLY